jgi:hypothetical protein
MMTEIDPFRMPIGMALCLGFTLVSACDSSPASPWTSARALAPALDRIDTNHDGKVTEDEYAARAILDPAFAAVDTNADGVLSLGELEALTLGQDPLAYGVAAKSAEQGQYSGGSAGPTSRPVFDMQALGPPTETFYVLRDLREEITSVNPNIPVPSDADIALAAASDSLSSEASLRVLAQLEQASTTAGLKFPARFRLASATNAPAAP